MVNDTRIAKFITAQPPITLSEEQEWLQSLSKRDNDFVFAVLKKSDDGHMYIGHMSIHLRPKSNGVATTGALLDYNHVDKGYGSEAKMLLLFYAFRFLGVKKVRTSVFASNERSKRYIEKMGHREIGVLEKEHVLDGIPVDEVLFELFYEDWLPYWEAYKKEHEMEDPF